MTSHQQPSNVHWLTPADYVERPRFVRPIGAELWPGTGPVDLPNLYDSLEERERIARVEADVRRDLRILRLQWFIQWASIGVALGTIAYFVAEYLR